jgi:Zn ribbon nucleic-acid-binding protein
VECVKRAEGILNAEKAGQVSSSADSVRAWTEKSVAVTECIQFGDKLVVAVIVSSEDMNVGNAIYNALRAGMAGK